MDTVADETMVLDALREAEEKILYQTVSKTDYDLMISEIKNFFSNDGRVEKACIFGSFARGDDSFDSDIDIMVRYLKDEKRTLLDYADIQYSLQKLLNRKVDLVEEGYVKPFAQKTIERDLKLIYG